MPAADYQLFVVDLRAFAKYDAAPAVRRLLYFFDATDCDQGATVYAHEVLSELVGQRLERVIDKIATVVVLDAHVFLVSAKTGDIRDGYEFELAMDSRTYVLPRRIESGVEGNFTKRGAGQSCRLFEGRGQSRASHGLQDISDSTRLESINGVLVVRRREDDGRWPIEFIQMVCGLNAVQPWHADVQQDGVRLEFGCEGHGVQTIARLADDVKAVFVFEQLPQTVAGRLFIVNDEDSHASPRSSGKRRPTVKRSSLSSTWTAARPL